ncbi:MAG: hypothetical protein Ta2A_08930 [Treponemataceae bacterium]|nr:MAG: hypothetical protein Ta2A_08930 [Treponemataceae bacterium]
MRGRVALENHQFSCYIFGMMTIQQTIDIPESREVRFTLPDTVPSGKSYVTVTFTPAEAQNDSTFSSGVPSTFPSIEELRQQAEQKAAERKASGRNPFEELRASMNGRRFMGGVDGLEYQRSIRDEWPL